MPIFIDKHCIKLLAEDELSEQLFEKLMNIIYKNFESTQFNIKRRGCDLAKIIKLFYGTIKFFYRNLHLGHR